jgi:ribosomal protein S18 acetylase RimI-like enzyme
MLRLGPRWINLSARFPGPMTNDTAASPVITLRPATAEDTAFLLKLFAGTRDEFKMLIADENQLAALMSMQFNLQQQQYQDGYPDGQDNIILSNGLPVGRMFTSEGERAITLVDIALLPENRNAGIGRRLLDELLTAAAEKGKAATLHVFKTNPAQRLYERLGFRVTSEDSMYFEMICEPQTT